MTMMLCVSHIFAFTIVPPYSMGVYLLRKTNDVSFGSSKYTYLVINEKNIKLKTIYKNGIFATKKSRTGTISLKKVSNFKILNQINMFTHMQKMKIMKEENDVKFIVKFNSVSEYTYSMLGIEFPEIKYKQIVDYNLQKNIRVQQHDKMLYITDEFNNYYIFDLYLNMNLNRLPFVETALYTLIFSDVIGFLVNKGLITFIHN